MQIQTMHLSQALQQELKTCPESLYLNPLFQIICIIIITVITAISSNLYFILLTDFEDTPTAKHNIVIFALVTVFYAKMRERRAVYQLNCQTIFTTETH